MNCQCWDILSPLWIGDGSASLPGFHALCLLSVELNICNDFSDLGQMALILGLNEESRQPLDVVEGRGRRRTDEAAESSLKDC